MWTRHGEGVKLLPMTSKHYSVHKNSWVMKTAKGKQASRRIPHNTRGVLKSRIYRLSWQFQVTLLSTVISHFRLTYVDAEMRNVKKDDNLCCVILAESLNGDIWNIWYPYWPTAINRTWFHCCHILISPSGSWKLCMTKDLIVLDYRSQKFHNNILLGINDSHLTYIISFSYCKFAEFKQLLVMASQSGAFVICRYVTAVEMQF